MNDEAGNGSNDAIEDLRRISVARLSSLQGPGVDARLRRAFRRPVRLRGLKPGVPQPPPPDGAAVLAKAVRRTAAWLKLKPEAFRTVTGLELRSHEVPVLGTPSADQCLALVRLGGRLERQLGRRGMVCAWLRGPHVDLRPTPAAVLARPDGVQAISDYLDRFER